MSFNLDEYNNREIDLTLAKMAAVDAAPLAHRREAREDWAAMLRDPAWLESEADNVLCGNYGRGAAILAWRAIESTRGNPPARLAMILAPLCKLCPPRFAAQAYRSLTAEEQTAADAALRQAITDHKRYLADNPDAKLE